MTDFRSQAHSALNALFQLPDSELSSHAESVISPDCRWHVSYPIECLTGPEAVLDGFIRPMRTALAHARRRDEFFIGGDNRRDYGGTWIAAFCHYVGNFQSDFLGIPASFHLVFLRAGEFYRIENGMIVEARIILDLPDLMRQAGCFPFASSYGLETLFPGPATHDGVLPTGDNGSRSLDIVEDMLTNLHHFDPGSFSSSGQTGKKGTWHEDMMWYGPAGIGSNYRWEGFVRDHREPFLRAFPDRKGGNHYCRIGDGNYAAVSGWPSMTMTFQGDYLGMKADGRPLTLRVMDFYRLQDDRIIENWVMLDYTELMAQMGREILPGR